MEELFLRLELQKHHLYSLYADLLYFIFQRYPTDRAYFIAKEILMTERTYKKDLEILNLVSILRSSTKIQSVTKKWPHFPDELTTPF